MTDAFDAVSLANLRSCRADLGEAILRTPVVQWRGENCRSLVAEGTDIWLKLELFQYTGTFKCAARWNSVRHPRRRVEA